MTLDSFFRLKASGTSVRTELLAGLTTFLAMAYILAVNPEILSVAGMNERSVFTATALSAAIATLIMGLWAKLPFALASGMGLNAFFAYTICVGLGYSWQFALTAVFMEGILFIILTLLKVRNVVLKALPRSLRFAMGVGIGLFITFNGLSQVGLVVSNKETLLGLGDFRSPSVLLALLGLAVTAVLLIKKVPGALLLGMFVTTLVGIPLGETHYVGIVDIPPSSVDGFCQFDFSHIFDMEFWIVVLTLFFVDFFDTLGTVVAVVTKVGVDEKNPRVQRAFMADAIGTTLGAMLGTNTVTTYCESAVGVAAGGRTGLTALVVSACFLVSLFFAPLFLSVPAAATSAVLVIVGVYMMASVKEIPWDDFSEAIPAFLCMLMMPFAFSIAEGIALGVLSYFVINLCCGNLKKLSWMIYVLSVIFVLRYLL